MRKQFTYFIAVLRRETTRIYMNKVTLFISFVAPVIGIFMLWWIFSAGVIRDLPVAYVNQDHTQTSQQLDQMLDASPAIEVAYRLDDLASAEHLMKSGKINAIVMVGNDFEKTLYKGQSPTVNVYTNLINVVSGGVVKSNIQTVLSTFNTGVKMQVTMKKGYTQQQALERVMPIRFDTHILFNPYINYSYFLSVGLIPLIVIVVCFLGTLYAFGLELKERTAEQLMQVANQNIFIAISGKMLPHTFIYLLHMQAATLLIIIKIGVPLHGSMWLIMLSELILVLAYQAIAIVFLTLTSNLRLSLSLGSAYTMMALTFAGLTFPTFAMPKVAEWFSYAFPYSYWLRIFMNETLRSVANTQIIQDFTGLIIFILVAGLFTHKTHKVFSEEKYWGKS